LVDLATLLLCPILLLEIFGFITQHLHFIEVPPDHALSAPNAIA
jgi:hypothetical protein